MKVKVLRYKYTGESSGDVVRAYREENYEQAEKDLKLLEEHASDCKEWSLTEVDLI